MSETKSKVTPEKRSWINRALGKLGRKPKSAQQGEFVDSGAYEGSSRDAERREQVAGALATLRGEGEDVSRSLISVRNRRIVGSRDKGYRTNVSDPLAAFADEVEERLLAGQGLTTEQRKRAYKLRADLVREQQGYQDRKKNEESEAKRGQRDTKAGAISERIEALKQLLGPARGDEGRDAFAALAEMSDIRKIEQAIAEMVDENGDNPEFMDGLFAAAMQSQAERELTDSKTGKRLAGDQLTMARNNLFRGNNPATKLAVAVVKKTEEGGDYLARCTRAVESVLGQAQGKMDFDPVAMRRELGLPMAVESQVDDAFRDEYEDRADRVGLLAKQVLDALMQQEAPRVVKVVAAQVAAQMQAQGIGDSAQIAKAIGAFVMLRLVTPTITDAMPKLQGDQRRAALFVAKAIQNMANGVLTDTKEKWTQPVLDAVAGQSAALNRWFLQLAQEGMEEVGEAGDGERS
jgi:hypothetical protein